MAWEKSPPGLIARFKEVAPGGPGAIEKPMFGYPAAFVGGNMIMGLHGDRFLVRVDEAGVDEAMALGGERFVPREGMVMKNYVALPAAVVADDEALGGWVARAFAFAASLPVKGPKPRGAAKAKANPK